MFDPAFDAEIVLIRRRRRAAEPLRLFGLSAVSVGILYGLAPQSVDPWMIVLFGAFGGSFALLAVMLDRRDGYSLRRTVCSLVGIGILAFAGGFLPLWLTFYYFPAHPDLYRQFAPRFDRLAP